jgi:hypothetical protein
MSHLFFSLSLSLLSRFEDEEREKERENRLSLYRAKPKARFVLCFFIIGMVPKRFEPIFFFLSAFLRGILRDQHTKLWKREDDEDNEEDEEEERRFQEEDFSLGKKNKRLDLNFFLSLFFTSRSLSYDLSFFAREKERESFLLTL